MAIRYLIVLFLPSSAIATGLVWHHFKTRPRTGRSPGFVWIAIGWFFASAALVGLLGVVGLIGLIHGAVLGSSTLGDERRSVDFAGVGAFIVGISLGGALLLVAVALSLLRGTRSSRWVAMTCSTLATGACVALAAVGAVQGNAALFLISLVLALGAAVPLPFLFCLGAAGHFSTGSPTKSDRPCATVLPRVSRTPGFGTSPARGIARCGRLASRAAGACRRRHPLIAPRGNGVRLAGVWW